MKNNPITKLAVKAKVAQKCEEPGLSGEVSKVSQRNHAKVSEKNYVKVSDTFESDTISAFAKQNVGRPTSYREIYIKQAHKLCLLGATDKDLADFFGVSEQTINNWKKNHPEFLESINRGKLIMDARVAESLYKLATGYSHPAEHVSNYRGEITITDIVKHYPPSVRACIFWLRNRQPEKWGKF